jgi:hypothetical protein
MYYEIKDKMKNIGQRNYWTLIIAVIIILLAPLPAIATTVFSDDTFDLDHYSIETFQSGGASINTSQTMSAGNSGAALQSIINVPSHSETFYTREYFLNTTFTYNPESQGAIESIDFKRDVYFKIQPGPLGVRTKGAVIFQNGNYYFYTKNTSPDNAVWQSANSEGLLATDFNLVTNLLTGEVDGNSHPDFTKGIIQFGTTIGSITTGTTAQDYDIRVDNISYVVNEVLSCGNVKPNLDIHMPSLNYQSPEGLQNLWADFEYYGQGSNGELLWKLKEYGVNQ